MCLAECTCKDILKWEWDVKLLAHRKGIFKILSANCLPNHPHTYFLDILTALNAYLPCIQLTIR